MSETRLFLIDATAFCYRAFYAVKGLSTSFGQPTNAIYGFLNMLNKVLKEHKPDLIGVCFDVSRKTLRQEKFAEYKSNRPPMPDDLISQIPLIKQIVASYGLPIFEREGLEADDIIAALVKRGGKEKAYVVVVSSDKDMLQLVDSNTVVLNPYAKEAILYDEEAVLKRFGVSPKQVSDVIALMGDSVDNIPSVPGVGEKTAVELIKQFGSLDNLLKHTDEIKQEKLKASVIANADQIKLNKELVALHADIDFDAALEELKPRQPDYDALFKLFKQLEFKKLLRDLPIQQDIVEAKKARAIKDRDLSDLIKTGDEIILAAGDQESFYFIVSDELIFLEHPQTQAKRILADSKILKIGHDLKGLKVMLAKKDMPCEGFYFDTMLAAYLVDPSRGDYSLATLAQDYLDKVIRPEQISGETCVSLVQGLKIRLEKALEERTLSKLFYTLEMPLAYVLAEMEIDGITLDVPVLKKLSQEIEKRLIILVEEIYSLSGAQFNINSPKQLREILFERLKLPVIKKSKTGPSTDEEVLRKLAPKHKLPELLLEYRQLTKLKSTYIDTLPELRDPKTGKIHTSFNQEGTETGRLSSSNPNLQNIPIKTDIGKQIRRAIVSSSENNDLLSFDYSQVELRILAHLSGDTQLISAFKSNRDIHKATAALLNGIEESEVSNEMREAAKRINFGIVYGLSAYGLARDMGIRVDEAQNFIDAYFLRYPGVKQYIDEQIKRAQKDGFVTTILGRRRYIANIDNKNQAIRQLAERQAVNTPIQGSASDLIKLAMVDIWRLLEEKAFKSKMILQIHDELLFDVPRQETGTLCDLVRERMEQVLELDVPVRVSIKKGKNWLEMEDLQ